jgi:hypothetical protein
MAPACAHRGTDSVDGTGDKHAIGLWINQACRPEGQSQQPEIGQTGRPMVQPALAPPVTERSWIPGSRPASPAKSLSCCQAMQMPSLSRHRRLGPVILTEAGPSLPKADP